MARYIVQMRRGSAEQWANSAIIPLAGELVVEIDEENNLHKLKIGDGIHPYSELAYLMAGDENVTQVLAKAIPHVVTITLDENQWVKNADNATYYSQTVAIDNITQYSRLDLQPDAIMIAEFKTLGLVFVTENINGAITVHSVGNKPLATYTMQATIVETDVEAEIDKIVGIPVGVPESNVQADWSQTNEAELDYIKNKPTFGTLSSKDIVEKTDLANDIQESLEKADSAATQIGQKQDTLVSGTNIKKINGEDILGSGNIVIEAETIDTSSFIDKTSTQEITGEKSFVMEGTNGSTYTVRFNSGDGGIGISDGMNFAEYRPDAIVFDASSEYLKFPRSEEGYGEFTLATQEWVGNQGYLESKDLDNYATREWVNNILNQKVTITATFNVTSEGMFTELAHLENASKIDWGDGSVAVVSEGHATHTYTTTGVYECKIYDCTSIGDGAFAGGDSDMLTNVVIHDSVTSIGAEAFYNCYLLENIIIGKDVISIGDYVFHHHGTMTVEFKSETPIEYGAKQWFDDETMITVVVPAGCKDVYLNEAYWSKFSGTVTEAGVANGGAKLYRHVVNISGNYSVNTNGIQIYSSSPDPWITYGEMIAAVGENITGIGKYSYMDGSGLAFLTMTSTSINMIKCLTTETTMYSYTATAEDPITDTVYEV